jgi:hypothetical protein
MRMNTRVRAVFTGGAVLLTLALSSILAAAAEAAPAVLAQGKTSGYPTDAATSTMGTAAVIVTVVAIVVTAGIIAYAAFGLDRGRTQLRVIEEAAETTVPSTAAQSEEERRRAA